MRNELAERWKKFLLDAFTSGCTELNKVAVVTDYSNSTLNYQAVMAWNIWWMEKKVECDWVIVGHSTSGDSKLMALGHAVNHILDELLNDVEEVHLFTGSFNAVNLALDCSHHSAQLRAFVKNC